MTTGVARAAGTDPWVVSSAPVAATVNGGFWDLANGPATLGSPRLGMCTATGGHVNQNSSASPVLMQPYYFPYTVGTDQSMTGYFDYRVKDNEELISTGTSTDGGVTWTINGNALQLNDTKCGASGLTDNGEGHPAVITVNGVQHLYTLDRASTTAFLLEHTLSPVGANTLAGQPASEPVSGNTVPVTARTLTGLVGPADGILGPVPGFVRLGAAAGEVEVMYLHKDKAVMTGTAACPADSGLAQIGKSPNQDLTQLRLAHTTDGLNFADDGVVTLDQQDTNATALTTDPITASTKTRFVGPHGTVVQYTNGTFGLFFSGGYCGDGDSDAYHYVGYAHSADAQHWIVDNGIFNPIESVDYSQFNTLTGQRAHYTGRVYSPSVTLSTDGKTATLVFSGYHTPQPLVKTTQSYGLPTANYTPTSGDPADYRAIMVATITRQTAPVPIVPESPWLAMLPISALVILGGGAVVARRRRRASQLSWQH